ncbi:hypothetical protein PaG_04723 [Moesziomyces aphidis]|uniref:Uncharacterized protein n=1 Tax=Moesziomyces aphidis TaxID=84754 RepID=W3VJ94_MOEAP|nr:hypothetical protein PaG_04723 [Moesziomyces aphidis]
MFSKTASLAIVALLSLSGAMATSPFGPPSTAGIANDPAQYAKYCSAGSPVPNQAYACFHWGGDDIRESMLEPDNAHGYMTSDGKNFVLIWDGKTQSFAFDDNSFIFTLGQNNCLNVARTSLISGTAQHTGPTQNFFACPNSGVMSIS